MPRFKYTARAFGGGPLEGTMAAPSREALFVKLLQMGLFPEKVRPSLSRGHEVMFRVFRRTEITRLLRQLHLLIAGEIVVLEAIALVREHAKAPVLRAVLDDLTDSVQAGRSLAETFREYPALFDELAISMIEAGETSGQLAFAFGTVAGYREQYDALVRKTRAALAYPALVVGVAGLVLAVLTIYIVPVFASMYGNFGAELPWLTRKVVTLSDFLRQTWGYWLGLLIAVIPGLVFLFTSRRVCRRLDRILLRLPILGNFVTVLATARFCRTMGSLLEAEVDILQALRIATRTTGNVFMSERLEPACSQLAAGRTFTDAMSDTGLFPGAMLHLSASGEKTGRLGPMLTRAADYYQTQAESSMGMLASLLEPLIILVLGVFIAFILIAMYLPLFDLIGEL